MEFMRYLKKFNESIHQPYQSIIDDCKDILLEVNDIGINTNISMPVYWILYIEFYKKITDVGDVDDVFTYSDIEDVFERLKSYLSEYGFEIDWQSPNERIQKRPNIDKVGVTNPETFNIDYRVVKCELHFRRKGF
jgi:hypothetical protein